MQHSNFPVTPVAHSRLDQVDFDNLGFGSIFSDHMFSMVYENGAWKNPEIIPYQALAIANRVRRLQGVSRRRRPGAHFPSRA